MSLATWKKEFYPKEIEKTTVKESVEHSILKWEGMLPKNLKKHNLEWDGCNGIVEVDNTENYLICNGDTCALCYHFYDETNFEEHECEKCPLFLATGRACGYHDGNEYDRVVDGDSPLVLINALKKARNFLPKATKKK